MSRPILRTELCDRLGIEYPILLAGMGPVAGTGDPVATADLVAAVSNAGGLGVMGVVAYSPDELRAEIAKIRSLTDRPFGVDLLLARPFLVPRGAGPSPTVRASEHVPAEHLAAVRKLAELRESGGESWNKLQDDAEHLWKTLRQSINYFKSQL